MDSLKNRILSKKAKIGIVGLGYVGLPLAVEFAKVGFNVVGIEQNTKRMGMVNKGENYISDVSEDELKEAVKQKRFRAQYMKRKTSRKLMHEFKQIAKAF